MFRQLFFACILLYCNASQCGNKEGICPFKNMMRMRPRPPCPKLKQICSADTDCPGEQKCCADPKQRCLRMRCMGKTELFQTTIKPGNCRNDPKRVICDVYQCLDDSHCKGDKKCCRNRCGSSVCEEPINKPKLLQCPYRVPFTKNCGNTSCKALKCQRKCCFDGCQHFCI